MSRAGIATDICCKRHEDYRKPEAQDNAGPGIVPEGDCPEPQPEKNDLAPVQAERGMPDGMPRFFCNKRFVMRQG